jgi:hypothetical protein
VLQSRKQQHVAGQKEKRSANAGRFSFFFF